MRRGLNCNIGALAFCLVVAGSAVAAEEAGTLNAYAIEIARDAGAGSRDCAGPHPDCIRVVADAWCEAHGHGPLRMVAPRPEMTASLAPSARDASRKARTFTVVCGE